MKLKSILILLLISPHLIYSGDDWDYEQSYGDNFLYLHSLVNYSYNAYWIYDYQKNLLSGNSLALNIASVTTDELMTDSYINLNPELGQGFRFRGVGQYRANRFENEQVKYLGVGLEKTIVNNIGIFFLANPLYEKEDIDISFGAQITSDNREHYFVAEVELEDFQFEEKNDLGAKSLKNPINYIWQLRYGLDRFTLYSSGKISTGSERIYEDVELSPDLRYHARKLNTANATLTYLAAGNLIASLAYDYYSFNETKEFTSEEENYDYDNLINRISIEAIYTFQQVNKIRILSNYIMQDASSIGYRGHDYSRRELASGLFYMRSFSRHSLEAGFLFSFFNEEYESFVEPENYNRDHNSIKLMLGYHYHFLKNAIIIFSVSHEIDYAGFGGGNLQYRMFF